MNHIKDMGMVRRESSNGVGSFSIKLSKKCERIATAIYLVTNFLSDTEPMKSRLRTLSLELVRDSSFIKNGGKMMEHNVLEALRANIEETLSLFELAFIAGLVSEMNFTILKREYVSLRDSIDIKKTSRESNTDTILGDNFFGSQENVFASDSVQDVNLLIQKQSRVLSHPRSDLSSPVSSLRGTKQSSTVPIGHSLSAMSDRTAPVPFLKPNTSNLTPSSTPRAITDVAKEARRARILKLIKDNREVAIRDIVNHFPDLSEKTIQRELVVLSDSGVLKKSGERRWSRYALA
ncbi:MAG: DeoR family transcriptional regulator [Candidatus Yonathbacteria bacterium]|nr:DeoR family transcriptional regulator [Candidatus Yonathbacteria bacterium]